VVVNGQAKVPVTFDYADESDPGPYPIPPNPPIEGGGDRHILIVDQSDCHLYELFAASQGGGGSWEAGSGAIWDLRSNALRPAGWTSADAAGLPILPGLVRYDEVLSGEIRHAIRFTVPHTRAAYVWPGRHLASSLTGTQYPPMGQRFRLRADFDISHFSAANQVILRAMKKYGMLLADNGSAWYISGAPDSRWNNDDLHALGTITGAAFEAVDSSSLMVSANSGEVRTAAPVTPAIGAAVNGASFLAGAAEGAWMSLFGTNLAPTTRDWRLSEIINGKLPVSLDGVSVTVNGVAAPICYISPTQINFQVPDGARGYGVTLRVTTPQGSASTMMDVVAGAPALFTYAAENHKYAAAQHGATYAILGKTGLYAGAAPARPGEAITFYGTGFGTTANPVIHSGYLVTQPALFSRTVTVRIGGVTAGILWAGRSAAGLDQLNVIVPPTLHDGDFQVVAEIGGAQTQDGVYVTVGH
jgi:uncharacterized protein (TIGR03437 family)